MTNFSGTERCASCGDDGWVVVATRQDRIGLTDRRTEPMDELGPCPFCEIGYRIEFPPSERWGPWGKEGFWRGNDLPPGMLRAPRENAPASREATLSNLSALAGRQT